MGSSRESTCSVILPPNDGTQLNEFEFQAPIIALQCRDENGEIVDYDAVIAEREALSAPFLSEIDAALQQASSNPQIVRLLHLTRSLIHFSDISILQNLPTIAAMTLFSPEECDS